MKIYERQSRTAYDEDGQLTAYDFCDATDGTVLQLVTEKEEITTLVKQEAEGDVMAGWSWGGDEPQPVYLSKGYAISGSVVLRRGMGVHVVTEVNVEEDGEKPARIEQRLHALGRVAEMGVYMEDQE